MSPGTLGIVSVYGYDSLWILQVDIPSAVLQISRTWGGVRWSKIAWLETELPRQEATGLRGPIEERRGD